MDAPAKKQSGQSSAPPKNRKEERRLESIKRQERSKRLKPLKEKLEATEEKIAEIESRRAEITDLLSDPTTFENQQLARELGEEFKQSATDLNTAYSDWDRISTDLERAEAEFS